MSGALQRCLEECLKLITLSVIGNRFAVVAVEIRPPPARTKIGTLACYVNELRFNMIFINDFITKKRLMRSAF